VELLLLDILCNVAVARNGHIRLEPFHVLGGLGVLFFVAPNKGNNVLLRGHFNSHQLSFQVEFTENAIVLCLGDSRNRN
jgi:hypothetical protein